METALMVLSIVLSCFSVAVAIWSMIDARRKR